ncbi:MAG: hypothetical protein EXX96DRAFT_540594 [Benjaminiella poitrasii]|nr:MAG: hypothetical protein EXX96DRAFT_540594 [Benjaminiella poitrasii]
MDSDALPSCLTYIENCYDSFDLIRFYKDFKFAQKEVAESIFKKCIGRFKRAENYQLRKWATTIGSNNFEILNRINVSQYWRNLRVKEARKEAIVNAEESIYKKLMIKFQSSPSGKRKRKENDIQKNYTLTIVPPTADNRWLINECDISLKFFELQEAAVEYIEEVKGAPLEESVYEIMSIQNILLMKPRQYNNQMLHIFGEKLLTKIYLQQFDLWVDGCPRFHDEEIASIQKIVNPLEGCKSENELWNTYIDPLLDSLLSNPENGVHLRWTNLNDNEQGSERPDSVISVMMQSNWGESLGYGEAKIAEPIDNKFMLACITVYTTTLGADGIYTMLELSRIQIPQAVESLELLTTQSTLKQLLQVAYVFEKIRQQKKEETKEFFLMKRYGPGLVQLRELISDKKDRKRPCTLRF